MYSIHYSNGRVVTGIESYAAAIDKCRNEWPDAEIGHDGDLTDGGHRTLVWADEDASVDDDGARAVAKITATYAPGDRVEGGEIADDYDTGRVIAHGDRGVHVAWDSGTSTWQHASVLRAEGERPIVAESADEG